jgi:sirohydrochlorin ferrochelatase
VVPCFADVRRPGPADALAALPGPCVVVPVFLTAGYHVRVDVPAQLDATGIRRHGHVSVVHVLTDSDVSMSRRHERPWR